MQTRLIYVCDVCARKNIRFADEDINVVKKHEAEHYNLTTEEYDEWNKLQDQAERCGKMASITRNETTETAFDIACEKLTDFEIKHNLKGKI